MMRKMTKSLEQVAPCITIREAIAKFAIAWLAIPVPIAAFAIAGFWLDCYQLNTFPLLTALGVVLGAILSVIAAVKIFVFGHNNGMTKNEPG
jgi:hypothetical protein